MGIMDWTDLSYNRLALKANHPMQFHRKHHRISKVSRFCPRFTCNCPRLECQCSPNFDKGFILNLNRQHLLHDTCFKQIATMQTTKTENQFCTSPNQKRISVQNYLILHIICTHIHIFMCMCTYPESERLHLNCAKMENKLDELSHVSGSRLRHSSSVTCGDSESKAG